MNVKPQKPLKNWTYEEVMASCAWLVIEAITKGEPLLGVMYQMDSLMVNWRKESGITLK